MCVAGGALRSAKTQGVVYLLELEVEILGLSFEFKSQMRCKLFCCHTSVVAEYSPKTISM